MTFEQLNAELENWARMNEAIREADAEIQPVLDICTSLEELGIRVEYDN